MRIWVITPVYRDVASFLILREEISAILGQERPECEPHFVVSDDTAGQDPDMDRLRQLSDVEVLTPAFNLGHQRAIVYALRKVIDRVAHHDVIVTLDADGEDQPVDLPRLIKSLEAEGDVMDTKVALALRTKRRESLRFKVMYHLFRLLFRAMTGTTVRSGNFAAIPGHVARRIVLHPTFNLAYSSAILAVDVPVTFVPCERGERYEGRSKMTFGRLSMHGLRMLMPFTDRIATRALGLFVLFLVIGVALGLAVLAVRLFTEAAIPGWASFTAVGALIVSLVALGNFVTLFVLFSQNSAVSLGNVEDIDVGDVN